MNLELTQEEMALIVNHRMKQHADKAYNEGISDCYNIVAHKISMGETRTEVLDLLKSLIRE